MTIKFGFFPSFNLKDIPSGLGSESRLDRSKGESRTENILMDSSSTLINNEGNVSGAVLRLFPPQLSMAPIYGINVPVYPKWG